MWRRVGREEGSERSVLFVCEAGWKVVRFEGPIICIGGSDWSVMRVRLDALGGVRMVLGHVRRRRRVRTGGEWPLFLGHW